ncbi:hypothetical protein [Thiohalomonas denitrificans]|uniref:hypothetical protein n=1 Tax=Thiohalomonas denitrificans TaxID=415747 RepID=UPI0026EDE326|nr:hypothetical protein [Thiohalomonas denitrificans]
MRADMMAKPDEYMWSSHLCNGFGKESKLHTPHTLYLALGKDKEERPENYRALFAAHVEGILLDEIRQSVNKGLAWATNGLPGQLTGCQVTPGRRGRPIQAE